MDVVSLLIVLASLFVGWNIGANDAANAIGSVVGSNIMNFRKAVLIVAFFALLGASLQSHRISNTVGKGIIPSEYLEQNKIVVLVALFSAGSFVCIMSFLGMPVSTNQAIIGSVTGAGIAIGIADKMGYMLLARIVICWVLSPIFSAIFAFVLYERVVGPLLVRLGVITFNQVFRVLIFICIAFVAYDLGANNIGNAMGPMMGANILATFSILGFVIGPHIIAALSIGFALGLGTATFGKRVVHTLGSRITILDPATVFSAQFASALVVYLFVLVGIPVSTTQAIVGGIVGVGLTKGMRTVDRKTLRHISICWFFTPLISAAMAIALYNLSTIV